MGETKNLVVWKLELYIKFNEWWGFREELLKEIDTPMEEDNEG
jgi:hypothetical protein